MAVEERVEGQLEYERRVGTRQAAIAAAAAVLLLVGEIMLIVGQPSVSELTVGLINAHKRASQYEIGAAINALGFFAVAATLSYLFGATRARNPQLKPFIRAVAIAGAVVAGLAGIAYWIVLADKAQQFITHGAQTYTQANQLTKSGPVVWVPYVSQFGSLLLAVGFVLTSLNAMRVGLLTRFMGYLGILVGVLVLIPIGSPVPIVQAYWLFALAYLLSGRWPTGVPPAWRSGKAEPWPSSQELREQRIRASGGAGRGRGVPRPAPTPAPETAGAPANGRTRATTPKRKRKKRR